MSSIVLQPLMYCLKCCGLWCRMGDGAYLCTTRGWTACRGRHEGHPLCTCPHDWLHATAAFRALRGTTLAATRTSAWRSS